MKVIAIIPSRLGSTRLPNKALAQIGQFSLVQLVYKRVKAFNGIQQVIVATDALSIKESAEAVGAQAIMTSPSHQSGTDRIAEALLQLDFEDDDIILNVQGDEPLISHIALADLISCMKASQADIATLYKVSKDKGEMANENVVKLVSDLSGQAMYFSRSPIPKYRNPSAAMQAKKHIGVYAFKAKILLELVKLPVSELELSEKLEQLRWLENGYKIHTVETREESIGVDTPEDLERLKNIIEKNH